MRYEQMEKEYLKPKWHSFDGELFQDLICDLLRREGFDVEPSGVGPDGGLDAIATQKIVFGYNNPESFKWGIQCKFSQNENSTISPSAVGNILNIVHDERFKSKNINGYFLATNVRLSTNLMGELRGLNNSIPGFKTTYWERSILEDILNKHWIVFSKYFDEYHREPLPVGEQPLEVKANQLEALLNKSDVTEAEICIFFEHSPELLLPFAPVVKAMPQVRLSDQSGVSLIPDFLVLSETTERWAIVELKSPRKQIVVTRKGRVRFSAAVFEGLAQLREYRMYFDSIHNRSEFKEMYGISIYRPRMILVIGMDYGELDSENIIQLKDDLPGIEIFTYTELLNQIKKLASMRIKATDAT